MCYIAYALLSLSKYDDIFGCCQSSLQGFGVAASDATREHNGLVCNDFKCFVVMYTVSDTHEPGGASYGEDNSYDAIGAAETRSI